MADLSYLDRKVERSGVAPIKDPQTTYEEALEQSVNQRAVSQYNPVIGRIDRRIDRNIGDVSYLSPDDINDRRYRAQSGINRLARGLGNMGAIAGTTFLDATLGNIFEALSLATGNGTFNPVTRQLNKWQENVLNRHQIYRPRGYEELPIGQQLFSSVFWGDLIQNAGFTVGMMGAGALGGALGLTGAMSMIVPAFMSALAEARTEGLQVKNDVISERLNPLTMEYNRRKAFITDIEELNALNKWYSDKYNEIVADSNMAGNTTYGINAALLMATNMLGWGSTLRRGATFSKQTVNKSLAERGVKLVDKNGQKLTVKALEKDASLIEGMGLKMRGKTASTLRTIGGRVKEALSEAGEEISQGIISDFSTKQPSVYDYTLYEEDLDERENIDTLGDAFLSAVGAAIGEKQTVMEGLMGAFTSILGVPSFRKRQASSGKTYPSPSWGGGISEFIQRYNEDKALRNTVNTIDKKLKEGNYKTLIDNLVRTKAFSNRRIESAIVGDDFNFKNYDLGELLSTVQTFDSIGRMDVLDAIIDKSQNITDEEALSLRDSLITPDGIATLTDQTDKGVVTEVRRILGENAERVKQIKKDYLDDKAALESSGHDFSVDTTGQYLFGKALLRDLESRRNTIIEELTGYIGNKLDNDGYANWDSSEYRNRVKKFLENDTYITPDVRESYIKKIDDLGRIDKAALATAASLQKIWDNPALHNIETASQKAEEIESNFIESERKRLTPIYNEIQSNESGFINTAADMLKNYQTSDLNTVMDMLSDDEGGTGPVRANEIQKLADDMRKFVQSMRKAGIEDSNIFNIIDNVLAANKYDNAASFNDALYDQMEKTLSKEDADKVKAEKDRLDKVDNMVKSKQAKGGLFSKGTANQEDSVEESDPHESDEDDSYDDKTREELIKTAEGRKVETRKVKGITKVEGYTFEDLAPDYHNYSDDDLREALRQDDAGKLSPSNPYKPKSKPEESSTTSGKIVTSDEAVEGGISNGAAESKKAKTNRKTDNLWIRGAGKRQRDNYAESEPRGYGEYYGDEDAFQIGRYGTLYNIKELKENHRAIDNSSNSFVGRLMRILGEEEWLQSGGFAEWKNERESKGQPLTVNFARVLVLDPDTGKATHDSLNTILAVIEDEKGPLILKDAAGNTYHAHVLGAVNKTSKTEESWQKFFDTAIHTGGAYASKTIEEVGSGKGAGFILPYYSNIVFAYTGRMVKADENYPNADADKNLLDIMPRDKEGNVDSSMVQFCVQTRMGDTYTIGADLPGRLIPLNSYNPHGITSNRAGTVWMRVLESNGQITHKYVSPKKFNVEEYPSGSHTNAPVVKRIKAIVSDIVSAARKEDLNAVKNALHTLRQYLQIPENKKLIIDVDTKIAKTANSRGTSDLTSVNAEDDLLRLIYDAGYTFNISFHDIWSKEDLIASDMLKTDLARVQNVNSSYIINQIEIHDDGTWSMIESEAGKTISVHSGFKGFQKDKSSDKFTINGETFYKTSDSGKYLDSSRKQVTDPMQIILVELYSDIVRNMAQSRYWFKNKNNPIYEVLNPMSNLFEFYLLDGTNLRKMTDSEIHEWQADRKGRGTKKDETIRYRIGNNYIAAVKFGKTHHKDTPDISIRVNNSGEYVKSATYSELDPLKGYKKDDGTTIIVPDYSVRGVLTSMFKEEQTFPTLFDYIGSPEKGFIPVIRKEAIIKDNVIQEKGLIEWVQVDIKTGNRVKSESESTENPTSVSAPSTKKPSIPKPKGKGLFDSVLGLSTPTGAEEGKPEAKQEKNVKKVADKKVTNKPVASRIPTKKAVSNIPTEGTSITYEQFCKAALSTLSNVDNDELVENLENAKGAWEFIEDFAKTHSIEETYRYMVETGACMPF